MKVKNQVKIENVYQRWWRRGFHYRCTSASDRQRRRGWAEGREVPKGKNQKIVSLLTQTIKFITYDAKARQVLAMIGFAGFAVVYAMRVNLSISIVSMVNHSAIVINLNQTVTDSCPITPPSTNSSVPAVSNETLSLVATFIKLFWFAF